MGVQLSIIIPVFREQKTIAGTLEDLVNLSFPGGMEIIVSDGDINGSTLAAIPLHLKNDNRIKTIRAPKGRGPQMNAGAAVAQGAIFWFLHADTRIDQGHCNWVETVFRSSQTGIATGAFDLAIDSPGLIFFMIQKAASLRSRLTRIPYGDQAVFMTRRLFEKTGGFPAYPIMEDVAIMQRIKRLKLRPVIMPRAVLTSARRWRSQGIVYTTLRNWVLILLYLAGIKPETLARFY